MISVQQFRRPIVCNCVIIGFFTTHWVALQYTIVHMGIGSGAWKSRMQLNVRNLNVFFSDNSKICHPNGILGSFRIYVHKTCDISRSRMTFHFRKFGSLTPKCKTKTNAIKRFYNN